MARGVEKLLILLNLLRLLIAALQPGPWLDRHRAHSDGIAPDRELAPTLRATPGFYFWKHSPFPQLPPPCPEYKVGKHLWEVQRYL